MNKKTAYRNLCDTETTIPIFSRAWWMDAVCGKENWDVILVEKGGQIVAALPYYFIKKGRKIKIYQPLLTQTNGIWIKYPEKQKYSTRLSYERKVMREMVEELEKLPISYYNQNFKYSISNWLPFYWRGFKQTTRYSYIISDLTDLNRIFENFHCSKRRNIRKAEKIVNIKEDLNIEEFYRLHQMTYGRQGMKLPYSFSFIKKFDEECCKHSCRKIFYAEDLQKRKCGAIYIVWDENSAYYIMGGTDTQLRNSEATSLLLWEAIKFSSKVSKKFDFEGSMIESIEKYFSLFGSEQKQYFNISKDYEKERILYKLARDIYDYYPCLQRTYRRIWGQKN